MKMQHVPLSDIVPNPWRDLKLFPIDADHVTDLRASLKDHGFFGGIKGRRRNGKVELGCGHARIEAARKAKLETVPIFIEDIDDDAMLRLMTDENATQNGANPGAVMNEVAAVTRRLIDDLLQAGETGQLSNLSPAVKKAFESQLGIKQAIGKLRGGNDVHLALGSPTIARYLGDGDAARSNRKERQIREAITALKQSGRYDDIVEETILKHPQPVDDAKPSKGRAVEKADRPARRKPVLDERVAHLFPNEHQFQAFREAVTTEGAKKVIPVDQQYKLAKQIVTASNEGFSKKQIGAPFIKKTVQHYVEQGMKAQRDIDKEEREQFLRDQREAAIDDELHSAKASVRSLLSSLARLNDLANEFPAHPKLGGFSARLDELVKVIQQFSKKLK